MQDITQFLTRIQTFNFELIDHLDLDQLLNSGKVKANGKSSYWIGKETRYWDSTNFESEMGLLTDMAILNLTVYEPDVLDRILQELLKVRSKFKKVWSLFHDHYGEWKEDYERSFIADIGLTRNFIVKNYMPSFEDVSMNSNSVEAISDSLKCREKHLIDLITACRDFCNPFDNAGTMSAYQRKLERGRQESEFIKDFGPAPLPEEIVLESELSPEPIPAETLTVKSGNPKIKGGYIDSFLKILIPYFPDEQITPLRSLMKGKEDPKQPLVFNGLANQLADAFKQLYESNLITGCKKIELERWINAHFVYISKNVIKEFGEGYIGSIISSDTRECKSPILEVKKKDDGFHIVETLRGKKNNKY